MRNDESKDMTRQEEKQDVRTPEGITEKAAGTASEGQKRMEEHMEVTMRELNVDQKNIINGMMQCEYVSCNYEEMSTVMRFPVLPWQVNRVGVLHGGMYCTAFDLAMAVIARFAAQSNFTPTVGIEVKFIRPAKEGQHLLVKTRATACGRRISQFFCEAVIEETGKLAATATSVYMNAGSDRQ
ncbi:MAG: PaaI family thioesterase [Clostridia bacterium]|nr:PaaI family thioesterase [Clostridia bacterium]